MAIAPLSHGEATDVRANALVRLGDDGLMASFRQVEALARGLSKMPARTRM